MAIANLSWDKTLNVVSYTIEYKKTIDNKWILYKNNVLNNYIKILNLSPGTQYDFKIISNYLNSSSNGIIETYITPFVDVDNLKGIITNNSILLSWNNINSAISYDIEYKISSNNNFNNAINSPLINNTSLKTINFNIDNLIYGTQYDFKVTVNYLKGKSKGIIVSYNLPSPNIKKINING